MTRLEEILARTRDFEKPVVIEVGRNSIVEMPEYDLHRQVTPSVMDSIFTQDCYDISIGNEFIYNVKPMRAVLMLRKVKNQYMREVNELQKEIDRITDLEGDGTLTLWHPDNYYELSLKPRKEEKVKPW